MTANVAKAMQLINNWRSLISITIFGGYVISSWRLAVIQSKCCTKRETASECASYYVHCHPQPSWTHLATQLYIRGEFAAVEELKPFLPLRGKCNVRVLHRSVFSKGNYSMGRHDQTRRIGTFSSKCVQYMQPHVVMLFGFIIIVMCTCSTTQ